MEPLDSGKVNSRWQSLKSLVWSPCCQCDQRAPQSTSDCLFASWSLRPCSREENNNNMFRKLITTTFASSYAKTTNKAYWKSTSGHHCSKYLSCGPNAIRRCLATSSSGGNKDNNESNHQVSPEEQVVLDKKKKDEAYLISRYKAREFSDNNNSNPHKKNISWLEIDDIDALDWKYLKEEGIADRVIIREEEDKVEGGKRFFVTAKEPQEEMEEERELTAEEREQIEDEKLAQSWLVWSPKRKRKYLYEQKAAAQKKLFPQNVPEVKEAVIDEHGRSYGTGRRKTSVARVWIKEGSGQFLCNGKNILDYFQPSQTQYLLEPFIHSKTGGYFDVYCTVKGGGTMGQAGAVRLGIARALEAFDPVQYRPPLRLTGMLTRDSRRVERKKPGRKKARRAFQWVKR